MISELAIEKGSFDDDDVTRAAQTIEERDAATAELHEYAFEVFNKLVAEGGPASTLKVFCRIDIGYWLGPEGKLSFFVNEVESGPTMSLWIFGGVDIAGAMGAEITRSLGPWVSLERERIKGVTPVQT